MHLLTASAVALLLAVPLLSHGQTLAVVNSLRGIKLGEELKASMRPECPKEAGNHVLPVGDDFHSRMGNQQCWTSMHSFALRLSTPLFAMHQVHNVEGIQGMLSTVGTSLIDGRIEAMESLFNRGAYESFREALVQRYGQFDKEEPVVLQYRSGPSITVRRATWSRPEALLRIDERVDSMDIGAVSVYSRRWLDAQRTAEKDTTERAKGKL